MQLLPEYVHPVKSTVARRPEGTFTKLIAIEGIYD
jgi:hypothetical protein